MSLSLFLSTPTVTLLALASGFIFGFLLRKATVSRFDVIVGQFLFKDFTVMEVILTAIVVGSINIYSLTAMGVIPKLLLSSTPVLFSLIGGSIFGIGMSVAGYCPGTAIAGLTDGAKEMIYGFIGMLFGSITFNELSNTILPYLQTQDTYFHQTLASIFHVSNSTMIIALTLCWIAFYTWRKRSSQQNASIQNS